MKQFTTALKICKYLDEKIPGGILEENLLLAILRTVKFGSAFEIPNSGFKSPVKLLYWKFSSCKVFWVNKLGGSGPFSKLFAQLKTITLFQFSK